MAWTSTGVLGSIPNSFGIPSGGFGSGSSTSPPTITTPAFGSSFRSQNGNSPSEINLNRPTITERTELGVANSRQDRQRRGAARVVQRRTATSAHTASTRPKGHAPCRKP